MTLLMNSSQVLRDQLTFSYFTIQKPTCSVGLLVCNCMHALVRTLFCGIMRKIEANYRNKIWYALLWHDAQS